MNEAERFNEGFRFGPYIVGPCIGSGSMARVYRARNEQLQRDVALKILPENVTFDLEGRYRFLREARLAAGIKHQSVVDIFDVGVCEGVPYLAMDLLSGEDLAAALQKRGKLRESEVADWVVPLAAGLAAGHDAGIVHGNLKPSNIFISQGDSGQVLPQLLDFGISREFLGTPYYLSPEALQGANVTPLSDQYSLSVIMYECVTGLNPFQGESFSDVFRAVIAGRYRPASKLDPHLSPEFLSVLQKGMSVDPAQRFPSVVELGRELLPLADRRTRVVWALYFGVELGALVNPMTTQSSSLNPTSIDTWSSGATASSGWPALLLKHKLPIAAGAATALALSAAISLSSDREVGLGAAEAPSLAEATAAREPAGMPPAALLPSVIDDRDELSSSAASETGDVVDDVAFAIPPAPRPPRDTAIDEALSDQPDAARRLPRAEAKASRRDELARPSALEVGANEAPILD